VKIYNIFYKDNKLEMNIKFAMISSQ